MKGDFTRNTFNPARHYEQVLMQQGRVQVDADWNEQAALNARRDETTAADVLGHCGGPANAAAFGVFTDPNKLSATEAKHLQDLKINKLLATGDFFLSAGRYYVDGIQCENEWAVPFKSQPDRIDVAALVKNKSYLLYLDVWQRHITALEDSEIRDPALGGPDTATRVKTIWQVRALELPAPGVDPNNPCSSGADEFAKLFDPGTALLKADSAKVQAPKDPCQVPPGAGFTGLENQLYRVEIHDSGAAVDAASNLGSTEVTLPGANDPENQITVKSGTWTVGEAVEIYKSKPGSSRMEGQLAWITTEKNKVLTLSIPVTGFVDADNPRLRPVYKPAGPPADQHATFKWSRDNGSVTTRIEKIDGQKITVSTLGPDNNLGFAVDTWVEIVDDALELEGKPGQLAQIEDVDDAGRIVTLKSPISAATFPKGILPGRNPKLRRWEGIAPVKIVAGPDANWMPLESGVQVSFAKGEYRTGHFWQIPARTATAHSPNGDIEWPEDKDNRLALAPRGITHHFCRLGIVTVKNDGSIDATDCRCLYPTLTAVPRLFYISGDGQEVMPDLTKPADLFPLAELLIVGVANLHANSKVRFTISEGNGGIKGDGQSAVGLHKWIDVKPTANGRASCQFFLETVSHHQQVTASVLDPDCGGVALPVIFNANLSIASEVAYDPGACGGLQGQKTVQDALSRLAAMVSLYKVSGDGQKGVTGQKLPQPVVVLAASRCGVASGLEVKFNVVAGGGSVAPGSVATRSANPIGLASCEWTLGPDEGTQELEAILVSSDAKQPVTEPGKVRFTAFPADKPGGDGSNDPAPVRVVDVRLLSSGKPLPNETRLSPSELGKGVALLCDRMILEETVIDPLDNTKSVIKRGQPTCFVTAEIPYPLTKTEMAEIDIGEMVGYRPVILNAVVNVERIKDDVEPGAGKPLSQIKWQPEKLAVAFLARVLDRFGSLEQRPDGVLLRLTLKGNFIWSDKAPNLFQKDTPGGFLDGDTFRSPKDLGVILPSGDKRRGGDFEMWFWVVPDVK